MPCTSLCKNRAFFSLTTGNKPPMSFAPRNSSLASSKWSAACSLSTGCVKKADTPQSIFSFARSNSKSKRTALMFRPPQTKNGSASPLSPSPRMNFANTRELN